MPPERHGAERGLPLLPSGSEHPWPDAGQAVALLEGEIAVVAVLRTPPEGPVLERRTLACLVAPCQLPPLPPLPDGVMLRCKVVRAARWEPVGEGRQAWAPLSPVPLPHLAERLAQFLAAHGLALAPAPATAGEAAPPALSASTDPRTPLHALATLNDTTYVEAARLLAARAVRESSADPAAALARAFELVLTRPPDDAEKTILLDSHRTARESFAADPASAKAFLANGDAPADPALDPVDHAALASVCLSLLNTDEALTKE